MQEKRTPIHCRVGRALRDAWLIAGLTLLLFLTLEMMYRAQRTLRSGATRSTLAAAGGEGRDILSRQFDPYRAWWPLPVRSTIINIDSLGRRHTVQPWLEQPPAQRVLMLGGSTMWGWTHPDSTTIPTLVARDLRERGLADVEVINLAQSTYNTTQEVITLLLELRRGAVADVVVFLDGHNEVSTAWATGRAGDVGNLRISEQAFERGRRGFREELIGLGRHSALVTRLARAVRGPPAATAQPGPAVCTDVARNYRNLAGMAAAWGREFGFSVAFFWQPVRALTGKRLSEREQQLQAPDGYRELLRACAAATDARMAGADGLIYRPLHDVFDADTATVFTDDVGHLTRHGNEIVAANIASVITPLLLARRTDPRRNE